MNVRIVRKIGWIVLGLALMLLCSAERETSRAAVVSAEGTYLSLTVADSSADEMHCERSYNSDLNLLTRLASEFVPAQQVVPWVRSGRFAERPIVQHGAAASGNGGTMCAVSRIKFIQPLFAGVPAVDFYVYRLHRLII